MMNKCCNMPRRSHKMDCPNCVTKRLAAGKKAASKRHNHKLNMARKRQMVRSRRDHYEAVCAAEHADQEMFGDTDWNPDLGNTGCK